MKYNYVVKKIIKFSPALLILVPFVRTFFNSFFIFENGEINLFFIFSVCYLLTFVILYKLLKIVLKNNEYFIPMYISSWIGFVFFQYTSWTKYYYYTFSGFILEINNFAFLTWLFFLVVGIVVILRLSKYESLRTFFGIWTLLLLITPVTNFLYDYFESNENTNKVMYEKNFENVIFNEKPDIYFILYDGLASLDTLNKYYDYKAEPLKKFLFQNKFFVAEKASSSYGTTNLSLATIFEAEYLLEDGDSYKINNRHILKDFDALQSEVFQILLNNEYTIASYSNYVTCQDNETKEVNCLYRKTSKQIIYELLLQTPFQIIENNRENLPFYNPLIELLNLKCAISCGDQSLIALKNKFDNELEIEQVNNPKFYFFHMKNTHGPFFVDENCEPLENISSISDAIEKQDEYIDSILCLQKDLEEFLKVINEDSIIILQSDHGPHFLYSRTYSDLTDNEIQNRYRIFSSVKSKKVCEKYKKPNFGQVNTFRFIFKCLSDESIQLKDTKSFYVPINPRFDKVVEITKRLNY